MSSSYLVQWMQGPCTEAGPSREFSIIGLKDIKEDYRYALECGRITMATYRFSEGQDNVSMHKLCKILGAGEESTLETEMLSIIGQGDSGQQKSKTDETAESEDITCIIKVEEIEEVDSTPVKGGGENTKTKYPSWEVQQEMVALLDENHQVKKENDLLRKKLAKAVDVMDLSNILETTIVNIRQKRITQPSTNDEEEPQTFGPQTVSVLDDIVDIPDIAMVPSEDLGFTSITSEPSASSNITKPSPSRQTPPGSSAYQPQTIHTPASSAQQHSPRTAQLPNTFQHQSRQAPAQHSPIRQSTVHEQQIRQATEQHQLRLAGQQLRQVQQQQQQQRQAAIQQQQQQRQAAIQQQQQRQAAVQQQQRQLQQEQQMQQLQKRLTPTSVQEQTPLAMSVTEDDTPYIVNVQSLVDPLAHSSGQTLSSEQTFTVPSTPNIPPRSSGQTFPSRTDHPGPSSRLHQPGLSGMSRMSRMHPSAIRRGRTVSQRLSAIRQSGIGKRPRTPQLQSSYVAQGYQQLQRARSSAQMRSGVTGVTDVVDMPSTSTQRPPPPAPSLDMEEQEMVAVQDLGEEDQMVELVPGTGVRLSQRQLRMAQRAKGFSQYTRNLMMLVFTMKELSVCSVTGFKATGKGSENAVARPALDPTRVYAIIELVKHVYPGVQESQVRNIMNKKVLEVRYKNTRRLRLKALKSGI